MENKGKTIQSVQRAIDILNCIAGARRGLTLKEISARLDLNENTVRGLAQTLQANGFLSKNPANAAYSLGYDLYVKGQMVYEAQLQQIIGAAYGELEAIAEQFNVSTCLQVSFHNSIYTVETVEAPRSHYAYVPRTNMDLPLHASASGKLMLAYMPVDQRKKLLPGLELEAVTEHTITDPEAFAREMDGICHRGYSMERGELSDGFSCVAAPFFNPDGSLRGSLSAVAASTVLDPISDQVVLKLKQACSRMDAMLTRRRIRQSLG